MIVGPTSGTTTINVPVNITGGQLQVDGNTAINGQVTLSGTNGQLQVNPGSGGSVAINGAPTLNNGIIAVNSGTLTINNNTGTATAVGTGTVSVTVVPTATLQLAGSASALNSSINVTNNGSTAQGGGLSVTGTSQVVGVVSDTSAPGSTTAYSGDTVVGPGASLTATQILQNTLTIGAGATVTIAPSGSGVSTSVLAASNTNTTDSATSAVGAVAASSDEIADPNDPVVAIQAAIASGSISDAKRAGSWKIGLPRLSGSHRTILAWM